MPFITFEGPDGCGKSTIIKKIYDAFQQSHDIVVTREPGGTEISEKIRSLLLDPKHRGMDRKTEAFLYAASRAQHVEELIRPQLRAGKIVLCDRFVLSSLAYQGYARELGVDVIAALNTFATSDLKPDAIFYFDLDVETSLERKKKQKILDRMEKEALEFHKKVFYGYKTIIAEMDTIIKIDATQSIDTVYRQCVEMMKDRCLL